MMLCDEDVTSTVIKALRHPQYRDAKEIVIWADNCTGQLKNWTFYSALIYEVNHHASINNLTIKYLVKGHTFMSADAFHSQVERAMKAKRNIYDFEDFTECISKTGLAVQMNHEDFYDCKNHLGTSKDTNYPYLADVSVFQARKGSTKMFWKNSHSEIKFESGEFLTKKYRESTLNSFFELPKKLDPGELQNRS